MKRIIFFVFALVAALSVLAGCTSFVSDGDLYEYKGFIIEVYENARGETAIVTIAGDVESTFIINESTKLIAPTALPVAVGDCIVLNTTRTSDEYVKECRVTPGYSTEGRLVFVEGEDFPFLLTTTSDGAPLLVLLIDNEENIAPGASAMGDAIRVYHSSAILLTVPTAQVEGLIYVENGSIADLTDEDIAFITSQGYTLKTE